MSSQNPQHDPSGKDQSLLRQIGRNAYRVLGLPANASWRDISQRGSTLQRAAKAGIPQSSPWNLEWYCPLRQDASAVSDALAKLSNPHQRPRERLFWVAQSETFVKYIPIQGLDASIESLRDTYSSEAQHDAAVLALISCFSSDPNVTDSERWEKMLEKWVEVAASEEFWSEFFNSEESGGFDRPASFEELDELRAGSLKLLTGPIAELARDAASRGDFERCRRALGVIRGTRMPAKLVTSIEEDVLGSYEESLNRICKEINKSCWSEIQRETKWAQANEKPCLIALTRWEQEVEPRYYEFIDMSGEESVPSVRVTERYADFLSRIANAHTWAAQWAKAEDLLLLALAAFPQENPAREDIVATLQTISAAASQQRVRHAPEREASPQLSLFAETAQEETETRDEPGDNAATLRDDSDKGADEESCAITAARSLAGFCDLCHRLEVECWEPFAVSYASPDAQKLAAILVRNAYRTKVAPWLEMIQAKYRGDTHVLRPIQNAAAECLNSLAGSFLLVNDFGSAHSLAVEGLALVIDNERIESEIKDCLRRITPEQKRSTNRPGKIATRSTETYEAEGTAIDPDPPASMTFSKAKGWRSRLFRLPSVATIGFITATAGVEKRWRWRLVIVGMVIAACGTAVLRQSPSLGQHPARSSSGNGAIKAEQPPIAVPAPIQQEALREANPTELSATPPTGTNLIKRNGTNGLGKLKISNYSNQDAAVKLKAMAGDHTVLRRFVYVRAGGDLTISGIPAGMYSLQFTMGQNWDSTTRAFHEDEEFFEFGKALEFSEDRLVDNSIRYSVEEVTLHTSPTGNVPREHITSEEFANEASATTERNSGQQ